jgi:iron(III)-salmochelin esterase
MMWTRREWLSLPVVLGANAGAADAPCGLIATEVALARAGRFAGKCLVLRPARVDVAVPLPVLVLLHGLGETGSVDVGIRAWRDRYGLAQAYARLCSPPVTRTLPRDPYLSDARLLEINRELEQSPFPDVNLVCPFTPNVWKQQPSAAFLDRYAEHLELSLLPAVRAALPASSGREHLGLAGVSLGGYVTLELFLRRPQLFGVVGCVQGAFSLALAGVYARRVAALVSRAGPTAIALISSSLDPYRSATLRLAHGLQASGVPVTLSIPAGPHDQRFLREVGTLELLLQQARALNGA